MVELLIFEATCPYGKKEIQLILNRVTEKIYKEIRMEI